MASLNIFIFGLYAVVHFVCLDVTYAQFPGGSIGSRDVSGAQFPGGSIGSRDVSGSQFPGAGILSRDPFQQPPFFHEPVSNIFAEGRRPKSRSYRPLGYSNYGSRARRSPVEYQQLQRDFATIRESTRVKRQAPMYQTWDFHPSSVAREMVAGNTAPISHQSNGPLPPVANPPPLQSNIQYQVPSNVQTNNAANPLPPNQINVPANGQVPSSHFNAILHQNNLALEPKRSKITMATTIRNGTPGTKQTNFSRGQKNKNRNNHSKTTGPRFASSKPTNKQTADQLQFDLTLAAAALLNGDKAFETFTGNNLNLKNQLLGNNKDISSGNKVTSGNDMVNNIQHLKSIIDRAENILMKKRNKQKTKGSTMGKAKTGRTKTVSPRGRMPQRKTMPNSRSTVSKVPQTKASPGHLPAASKIKGRRHSKQTVPVNNIRPQSMPSQPAVTVTQPPQRPNPQLNMQYRQPQMLGLPPQMPLEPTLRQEHQPGQQPTTQPVQHQPPQGNTAMNDLQQQLEQQMINMIISQPQTDPKETIQMMQQQLMQQQLMKDVSIPKGLQLLNNQQNPQIPQESTSLLQQEFIHPPTQPQQQNLKQAIHGKSQLKKSKEGKQRSSKVKQQQQQRHTSQKFKEPSRRRPSIQNNQQQQMYQIHTTNAPGLQHNHQNIQKHALNARNHQTPRALSTNNQPQPSMFNNHNQPTPRPLPPNYQPQPSMLNTQNQPTPRPLSPNHQPQQAIFNTHNQPMPQPLSSNHQPQPSMLNSHNQPTPRPLSPNNQPHQAMLNVQNQPMHGPLSPNFQPQPSMLNTQPTPRPLSSHHQPQPSMLNSHNQPTPRPLPPNNQPHQAMLNAQNQPIPGPLSPNFQPQPSMLNTEPTPRPLSSPHQPQLSMLNSHNQPTPRPLPPNHQPQQAMLNTHSQSLTRPLSPNHQPQPSMLNSHNQPTPRPLSTNNQPHQAMLNVQNQPMHGPLSPNFQPQLSKLNTQNQPTPRPLPLLNQPTYLHQPSQFQQQNQQQLLNTRQQLPQGPQQQAGHTPLHQNPSQYQEHHQQIPTLAPVQNNRQNIQNQMLKSPTTPRTLLTAAPRQQTFKQNQQRFQQGNDVVHGIPLPLDGHGLSPFKNIPYTHRNQHAVYKATTTTSKPPRNAARRKQRQRIPHEQFIMYRPTTTTSPGNTLRRRQRNHSRRISRRPFKQRTTAAPNNQFLEPVNIWNPSPNTPAGSPVAAAEWRNPVNRVQETQYPNPTPIVPSQAPQQMSRGTVSGGNYVKNWFHPRRFDSSQGNSPRPLKISESKIQRKTKNQTRKLSKERQRVRSKHIVSQQTRNGRRPGIIRHTPVMNRPQTKHQPGRKPQPEVLNHSHYSKPTTAKPTTTTTAPTTIAMNTPANIQQNSWNQPSSVKQTTPGNSRRSSWNYPTSIPPLFSASADPFRSINFLNARISKNDSRTNISNQSTVTDVKKNKTISITQQIRTINNATPPAPLHHGHHNHAHAPINFNVFLEVKPTPTPRPTPLPQQHNSSKTGDILRLLEAFQILKGSMRPPTTMMPPVQFVFQMEPNVQQPAKLTCKCFNKSDGCPAELKEEHLMDMCYKNDTIPCCDDG